MRLKIIILGILFIGNSWGQYKIKVREERTRIGGNSYNALIVTLYEAKANKVFKEWKSQLKKMKAKVEERKDHLFADNAVVKDVSNNTVDIYSSVQSLSDNEVQLAVAVDLGGAIMTSSGHPRYYNYFKERLRRFAIEQTKNAIKEKLKNAQQLLKTMEGNYTNLVKEKEKYKREIQEAEKRIEEAKKRIAENEKLQALKQEEIAKQKELISKIEAKLNKID